MKTVTSQFSAQRIAVAHCDLPGDAIDRLSQSYAVDVWNTSAPPTGDALTAFLGDAQALICSASVPINDSVLAQCPQLHTIALVSVGYDRVDLDACRSRGVLVTNTPGTIHQATADIAMLLMLGARRLAHPAIDMLRGGRWKPLGLHEQLALDMHGAKLGIVGMGDIGRQVAKRAHGFSMDVVHFSRTKREEPDSQWVEFDELLATSDVVSLHVPLSAQTRHMIGARELSMMKQTATLVNTGRGGLVDTDALVTALSTGLIHSAGLDVFEVEPFVDVDHPLLSLPNAFVLPHVGSATEAARSAMVERAAANVAARLRGEPALTPVPELADLNGVRR